MNSIALQFSSRYNLESMFITSREGSSYIPKGAKREKSSQSQAGLYGCATSSVDYTQDSKSIL